MTTQPNDGLLYLHDYPKLRKWINQCAACQRIGHRPDLPDRHVVARTLRRYFPPLPLDEIGLCEQCSHAVNRPDHTSAQK